MQIVLSVKINNQSINSYLETIRVLSDYPVFTWSYDLFNAVSVIDEYTGETVVNTEIPQLGYELRISTFSTNIGTDNFIGNRVQTDFINSQNKFWNYVGIPLERGTTYYGQVYIRDEINNQSEWHTFCFKYNALPSILTASISPGIGSINEDLNLSYVFNDEDGDAEFGSIIRWFKNGIYQSQLNNLTTVQSNLLQIGDTWSPDISPGDSYEYGERYFVPSVKIVSTAQVVSEAYITPEFPNENDILKANYECGVGCDKDKSSIRWYINNQLVSEYNDQNYIRPIILIGDVVRFEVKSENGSIFVSSKVVEISSSDFVVYNIKIDGEENSLEVYSLNPVVKWEVYKPKNKNIEYVSIKIGTFYDANNVYSTTLNYGTNSFVVPNGLLNKGIDYYISIAVGDTTFLTKYTMSHFRTTGSRWDTSVDNSTGWTIETLIIVGDGKTGDFNEEQYQVIHFHDGTKFGEVRIYNTKIGFMSNVLTMSDVVVTTGVNILTICGKNNNMRIYLNRKLVLNADGLFLNLTTDRKLIVGNRNEEAFIVGYKYFYYTTSGVYYPGVSSEYSLVHFYTYLEFDYSEIVSLKGYLSSSDEFKIFAVNPDDENDGSSIYKIISDIEVKASAVSRTFAPINHIKSSPDGKMAVFSHYKGTSVITSYLINPFDYEIIFVDNGVVKKPDENGWDLVKNFEGEGVSFDEDGLHINTLTLSRGN